MKLQTKLIWTQAPLVLALLLIGALGVVTVSHLGNHASGLLHDNFVDVIALREMEDVVERLHAASLSLPAGRRVDLNGLLATLRPAFDKELSDVAHHPTEEGEVEMLHHLRAEWRHYVALLEGLGRVAGTAGLAGYDFTTLEAAFDRLKASLETVVMLNREAMIGKSDNVHHLANRLEHLVVVSTLLAIISALVVALWLVHRLLRPLAVLTQAAQRLGQGDRVWAKVAGNDEIGLLAREFNTMAEAIHRSQQDTRVELQQAQRTSQAAIDSLPDPVLVLDGQGGLVTVNTAGHRLLGIGQAPEGWPPALQDALREILPYVMSGKGVWQMSSFADALAAPGAEGTSWFLIRAAPLLGEHGIVGATVLLQDVTRMHRFSELRSDLIATVAHEFRTPLTSLHMAIHLCLDATVGELNQAQTDLLEAANEDCRRLQTMVEDLLDISRIQSGRVEMKRQPLPARELLVAARERHLPLARKGGVELVLESDQVAADEVLADPERINIVLTNLITNALRHTQSSGTVHLAALGEGPQVRFLVRDTGAGIAPEYQQRVFDKFFRVPGEVRGGAGLGLSVCREVVEAHGGQIGVSSQPGRGSTFWFTLRKVG